MVDVLIFGVVFKSIIIFSSYFEMAIWQLSNHLLELLSRLRYGGYAINFLNYFRDNDHLFKLF